MEMESQPQQSDYQFLSYATKQIQQAAQQPSLTITTSQVQKDVIINNQILIPSTLVDFFKVTIPLILMGTAAGRLRLFASDCWPWYQQVRIYLNNELIETINDAHLYSKQNNYLTKEDDVNTGKYFFQKPLQAYNFDSVTAGTTFIDAEKHPQLAINNTNVNVTGYLATGQTGKNNRIQRVWQQYSSLGVKTADGATSTIAQDQYITCRLSQAYPNTFFSIDKPIYVKNLRFELIYNSVENIYFKAGGDGTNVPVLMCPELTDTNYQIAGTAHSKSGSDSTDSLTISEQYFLFDALIDQSMEMKQKVAQQSILFYHPYVYNNTQPSFNVEISQREMGIISHVCVSHFNTLFTDTNNKTLENNKLNIYQGNLVDRCGQPKVDQLIINCNGTEICNRNIGTMSDATYALQNSQFNLLMNYFYNELRKHPQVIKKEISYNDFIYYNTPMIVNYQNPDIEFSGIENKGQFNISFQQSFVLNEEQATTAVYKTYVSVVGVKELSYDSDFNILVR